MGTHQFTIPRSREGELEIDRNPTRRRFCEDDDGK